MAHYHFTHKVISFGKGQSALHSAAYNAREQLFHEAENRLTSDYSRHSKVLFSGIFAPENAPDWARDRAELWNRAEAAERHKNGQPARNLEFSIPHELTQQQRERLVKDFVREAFVRRGMVADVSMHAPDKEGDSRNVHVHCLLTMRHIENGEFTKHKTKAREWNNCAEEWREKWAHMGANALERAGYTKEAARFRYGHLSKAEQLHFAELAKDPEWLDWCGKEAQTHKGPKATAQERRGQQSERSHANDNSTPPAEPRKIDRKAELAQVEAELLAAEKQLQAARRQVEAAPPANQNDAPAVPKQPGDLPKSIGDIRLAWTLSGTARDFAEGLEARGLSLAVVSAAEAAASIEAAAKAKEAGKYRPTLKAGELVAVNQFGDAYQLNKRTTGADRASVERFTAPIDRAALLDVTATKEALREAGRAARAKEAEQRGHITGAAKGITTTPAARGFSVAGTAASLADWASGFLANLGGAAKPDPVRQAAQQIAAQRRAIVALQNITAAWERGDTLKPDDLAHLTPHQLEGLAQKGDDYMRHLIDAQRAQSLAIALGRERER